MARDPGWLVLQAAPVTPAGTAPTAPQTTNLITGWLYINRVRYRFPPGPMGCLGFFLTTGNNQIIPWPPSQPWITDNDAEYVVDFRGQAGSGLQVVTANVGNFAHQLFLTIEYYDAATIAAVNTPALLGTTLLSSEMLNTPADQASGIEDLFQVNEGVSSS